MSVAAAAGGRLYLAGAMSAGREAAGRLARIAAAAAACGWRVLTGPVLDPREDFAGGPERAASIFRRDMAWLRESDAVIAEISTPSHGVSFEIAEALRADKPVLCLRDSALAGRPPSAMIVGNPSPRLRWRHCADAEIAAHVVSFLRECAPAAPAPLDAGAPVPPGGGSG